MKTFMTAAAIVAALTFPALAEGDDPSTKQGEAKGNVKASTSINSPPAGSNAMGGQVRATTGANSSQANDPLIKESQGTMQSPGKKTGVSGGADGGADNGGSSGTGGAGGAGGAGGGSGGSGSR